MEAQLTDPIVTTRAVPGRWITNAGILWAHRRTLLRTAVTALLLSLIIAFVIPKRYRSSARIMPPESSGGGAALIAALTGHSTGGLGALGGLAGGLLETRNSSALFVDLLRSSTVTGKLIDRFHLQRAYHKKYRIDTAKYLVRHTTIVDDKKSGVITLTVDDSDPARARDLAQAYLEELNLLVNRTNVSSARQERIFIERRLKGVESELESAQQQLSEFSSTHTTLDIKEQTRSMVEVAAKLQAEQILAQSEVDSLGQIYGSSNVRIRVAQARVAELQKQLVKLSGTSAPLTAESRDAGDGSKQASTSGGDLYPALRQLPRLAVPYADLYRRVRVQEVVYELLTQQYEAARIQEAKDVPVLSVIDAPGLPEKKSFPPACWLRCF